MELRHVILFRYLAATKKHERYDALVIGSNDEPEATKPMLNLVYFDHLNTNAHHALTGIDWANTLQRLLFVPHQDDVKNEAFYWVEDQREVSAADLDRVAAELQAKDSTETSLLKEFLMKEYKSETGDETPVHCAIRLLTKKKKAEK